jgi:hypothetical protein
MTIEALLIIIGFCLFACYLVFKWQESVVDMAIPPYQEPVAPEPDLTQQWVAATKADTLDNIDNWNAKVGDKIWYKQDDGALTSSQLEQIKDTLEPTVLNPKAAWPFPSGSKP